MHDEVDREFLGLPIEPADGVRAEDWPGFLRHDVAHLVEIERLGIDHAGVEENEFDVAIGGGAARLGNEVVVPRQKRGKAAGPS